MAKSIQSLTTPNHKMQLRSWLAELVMTRAYVGQLSPYFWREQKWKWIYANEVKAATKFLKKFGESAVAKVLIDNRNIKSVAKYAEIEYLLQNEAERLVRLARPKDISPIEVSEPKNTIDLRDFSTKTKIGLFDKLGELENGRIV